ncbi:hypothetical protein H072_8670 [Dactylellina haptotyla CBS 200.50]|uniref:non-specific serine/threonine protein kinase n=1 Tax=Dactylellina haptotyla (strain CBS 200.50) TaxID=1284197 RepID=S8BQV6_DACHA|nr:hypothetical protein H072_8670 [Dactylellina haptotyla CBS 200.50]
MPPKNQKKNNPKGNAQNQGTKKSNDAAAAAIPPAPVGGLTDYEDIQRDEVESIQAIYANEFEHVEKAVGAWTAKTVHCFKLHLKAESDSEIGITLNVEFPSVYPKVAPAIELTDSLGLRPEHKKSIKDVIDKAATSCMGTEMMSVIIEDVIQYLNDRGNTKDADAQKPTLFEERALKEEAEKKRQAEAEAKAEKERKAEADLRAEAERKKTQKAFNQAQHQRRLELQSSQILDDDLETGTSGDMFRAFPERLIVKDSTGKPGRFRKVGGMVLLEKNGNTSLYTVRPIFEVAQDFDVALALKEVEWTNPHPSSSEGTQLLTKLETDLAKLIPSEDNQRHSSVVEVFAMSITELPMDRFAEEEYRRFRIDILMEFANKGSLEDLLESVGKLSVSIVRSYVLQLIDGLRDLHQAGIVHRKIHPKNILLFRPLVGGKTIIKFGDPGISYRLRTLQNYEDGVETPLQSDKNLWAAPELMTSTVPTKKTDIWDLAVLILQMVHGLDVIYKHVSPQIALSKERVPSALKSFLARMFIREQNKRLGAFDLVTMEFLRQGDEVYEDEPSDSETVPTALMSPMRRRRGSNTAVAAPIGRYSQEWDEIQRLGRGGFGEVVKARNKYDGNFYAIKKVLETSSNTLDLVLKEVLLLSQLNHPNVVRYYSTWMEQSDRTGFKGVESSEEDYSLDNGTSQEEEGPRSHLDYISLRDAGGIEFGYSSDGSEYRNKPVFESDSEEDSDDGSDEASDDDEAEETPSPEVKGRNGIWKNKKYISTSDSDSDGDSISQNGFEIRETDRMQTGNKPDEIDSGDDDSSSELRKMSSSERQQIPMILYIQMEFCDKQTLRDAIDKDLYMHPDDYWQFLRQILDGLDYIHKKGIIHRDLKPENIFLSQTNMPRIGDFGLAASVGYHRPKSSRAPAQSNHGKAEDGNESVLTTQIGTRLYMAPEVLQAKGHYTTKVDMYSLGIIFFEMCSKPAGTSFELQEYITGLKSEEIKIPSCLNPEVKSDEVNIVRKLLHRKPSERPDAAELLTNHSIPLRINDDNFNKVIESLDDPSTKETRKAVILRKLFSEMQKPANDPFFDNRPGKAGTAVEQLVVDMQVKEKLLKVFKRHGAVEVTKNFLVPDSQYYEEKDASRLMNERGDLVQLRYDQVLPHARLLAIQDQTYPKSYSFGIVFRENVHGFGQPSIHGEVVFDFMSKSGKDFDLKEAETIKVVDEIIDSFSFFQNAKMGFNINHSDILKLILDFCGIEQADRRALLKELSKLWTTDQKWDSIIRDLKTAKVNISAASLAELRRFDWREQDFDKGYKRLKGITSSCKTFPSCSKAFEHMRTVFDYLKKFDVKRKAYFTPLSIYNDQYYQGGLVFSCSSDGVSNRQVLASGGRYDDLIRASRPISTPGDIGKVHAFGFKLSFDALSRAILKHHSRTLGNKVKKKRMHHLDDESSISTRRCDVIINATSTEDLKNYGVRIAASLWSNNIRAELDDDISMGTAKSYTDSQYGWQIIIKGNIATQQTVKVRNLRDGDETDQLLGSLVGYLVAEIGDMSKKEANEMLKQRRLSSTQDLLPSMRHKSGATGMPSAVGGTGHIYAEDAETFVIWPTERKGSKKPNRPVVIDNARRKVSEVVGGKQGVPIVAIDVYNEVLEAIRQSQLQGSDGWKKVIQTATNGADKAYLQEVQAQVMRLAQRGFKKQSAGATALSGSCCYIYNYRTDACIFYYLS